MIAEALSGIEFSPNPQVARLLADDDTHSTQPTAHDSYPPLTPTSDIYISAALETPRHFRNQPSPLSSPLASPDPVPPSFQQPNHHFPETSPPAPLTPFADLPTPSRWLPSPTPQRLTPGMFLQTPESLKRNKTSPNNNSSQPPSQVQQPSIRDRHVHPADRSPLNALDTPKHEIDLQPAKRGNSRVRSRTGAGKTSGMAIQHVDNPPEVRRRLFEQDDEDDTGVPETPHTVTKQPSNSIADATKSQENGLIMPGLKSRLAPPPPIRIPGVPNTTPGGIYPVSKNLKQDHRARVKVPVPKAVLPSFDAEKFSEMIARRRDAQHPYKVTVSNVAFGQQCKKKKSRAKPEVESKRPMTERASLVLAEMRRQMSEAQSGGTAGASAGAVADGTDATNFLPYSSAVQAQAPPDSKKEKERTLCNCKASQCIKRYCPCFATSNFCGKGCGCRNCENTSEYSSVVGRARRVLLERDPNAFVPRIRNSQRSSGRGRQTIRGCNCRKGCGKNYCICRENGLICGVRCTCSGPNGCQNYDESKLEEVPKVIENAPHSSYPPTSLIDQKTLKTRAVLDISSNMLRADAERNVQARKVNVPQLLHQDHANTLDIPDSPGLGPFDVLPTPTTPSIPYNPFFEGDSSGRKRTITFGNPLDGYKKIKIGDPNGSILPKLRQSASRQANYPYETPSPRIQAQPGTFTGTPLTNRLLSGAEPAENSDDKDWRGHCNGAGMSQIGGANPASNPSEDKRIPHVPRIFRYKFGSGKGTSSFYFKS